jgi:hypothetical protein
MKKQQTTESIDLIPNQPFKVATALIEELNQTELEWLILIAQGKVEYLKKAEKLEVQQ